MTSNKKKTKINQEKTNNKKYIKHLFTYIDMKKRRKK